MAGNQSSFSWKADTLTRNTSNLPAVMERMITSLIEYHATRGESYMRKSARWRDQTSNARNGLHTSTLHTTKQHTIVFAHGVNYGIWLEVRWAGKYAVILPSVQKTGAEVMGTLNKAMERIG